MAIKPKFSPEEHEQFVQAKRRARMERVDQFDPETRALIHQYGFNVVNSFVQCGVTKPRHIKHLVERILDEFSPTRGTFSNQGVRVALIDPKAARNG